MILLPRVQQPPPDTSSLFDNYLQEIGGNHQGEVHCNILGGVLCLGEERGVASVLSPVTALTGGVLRLRH